MTDDDDDDGFLLDDGDEDEVVGERALGLVVPGVMLPGPNGEDRLLAWETECRMNGQPPVMFTAIDDENGVEVFENPEEFARLMGLPAGVLPTIAEADAWSRGM